MMTIAFITTESSLVPLIEGLCMCNMQGDTVVTTHCNTLRQTASHCLTLQHLATPCNTLHHTAPRCTTIHHTTIHHTTTHCNALQPSATHCNTLHHSALQCTTVHHTATHCTSLHHTTPHCSTLQPTAAHRVHIGNTAVTTATSPRTTHTGVGATGGGHYRPRALNTPIPATSLATLTTAPPPNNWTTTWMRMKESTFRQGRGIFSWDQAKNFKVAGSAWLNVPNHVLASLAVALHLVKSGPVQAACKLTQIQV